MKSEIKYFFLKDKNININIEIERSFKRQRTIRIEIKNGVIRVLVPFITPDSQIEKILHKNRKWINLKLINFHEKKNYYKVYENLEKILFKGKKYVLSFCSQVNMSSLEIKGKKILISVSKNSFQEKKKETVRWLFSQANIFLRARINRIAQNHSLKFRSVSIYNYKSRWGSCSTQRDINLNWKLIMLPIKIIDYVLIHELCHTKHMNHSNEFWNLVFQLNPNFKENRKHLKNYSYLNFIF